MYRSVDPAGPGKTKEWTFDDTGKMHIRTTQDVQPILDLNHAEADHLPRHYGEARWRKVGSIPEVVAQIWSAECGAAIGTREFTEYAKRKLMDGEYAKLRVKGL